MCHIRTRHKKQTPDSIFPSTRKLSIPSALSVYSTPFARAVIRHGIVKNARGSQRKRRAAAVEAGIESEVRFIEIFIEVISSPVIHISDKPGDSRATALMR